jgi:hypothetical protein
MISNPDFIKGVHLTHIVENDVSTTVYYPTVGPGEWKSLVALPSFVVGSLPILLLKRRRKPILYFYRPLARGSFHSTAEAEGFGA